MKKELEFIIKVLEIRVEEDKKELENEDFNYSKGFNAGTIIAREQIIREIKRILQRHNED